MKRRRCARNGGGVRAQRRSGAAHRPRRGGGGRSGPQSPLAARLGVAGAAPGRRLGRRPRPARTAEPALQGSALLWRPHAVSRQLEPMPVYRYPRALLPRAPRPSHHTAPTARSCPLLHILPAHMPGASRQPETRLCLYVCAGDLQPAMAWQYTQRWPSRQRQRCTTPAGTSTGTAPTAGRPWSLARW